MRQGGFEPPTRSLEGCCSIHLSYWRKPISLWRTVIELKRTPETDGITAYPSVMMAAETSPQV